jgi:hypothetical protein
VCIALLIVNHSADRVSEEIIEKEMKDKMQNGINMDVPI